jgi:hypothetical protein
VPTGKRAEEFHLEILAWIPNPDALILREPVQETDPLVKETIPGVAVFVLQLGVSVRFPFFEEHGRRILAAEHRSQSALEAATEDHPARVSFSCQPSR